MSKLYVYSTLSADQVYRNTEKGENGLPRTTSEIFVAGKANITDKHFVTPRGMVTEVTAEQLAQLRGNPVFCVHEKNGFITTSEAKEDAEKVASGMQSRDQSAPLEDGDFGDDAPKSNRRGRPRKEG